MFRHLEIMIGTIYTLDSLLILRFNLVNHNNHGVDNSKYAK